MLGLGSGINRLSAAEAAAIAARSGGYLLDTYSGAAAAYSLRQLSGSYSGNAIKVRRASDNAEADIRLVNGELDTTGLASHCGSSDGFVSVWYDQSSNSNDATQTTAADQPKIYDGTTGLVTRGGKPSAYFVDGVDHLDITAVNNISYIYVGEPLGRSQAFGANSTSIRTDNTNGYRNYGFEWANQDLTATHNGTDISSTATIIPISGGLSFDILLAKTSRTDPQDAVEIGRENAQYISELITWESDKSSDFAAMSTAVNNFYNIY